MKKNFLMFILLFVSTFVFSQENITVDITDDVYTILNIAEVQGLCSKLSNPKPYTQKYIVQKLNEIKNNLDESDSKFKKTELKVIDSYLKKYDKRKKGIDWLKLSFSIDNNNEKTPISFNVYDSVYSVFSTGRYTNKNYNSSGFEFVNNFNFNGDISKYFSYRVTAFLDLTKMPLQEMGTYDIGKWWYESDKDNPNLKRYIIKRQNNSFLPFSYKKIWDGSIYFFSDISASGLEGWPEVNSFGFGMLTDLRFSFLNDKVNFGIARINREWGAMDNGSSLVLNAMARPFAGIDYTIKLFDFLSFSGLTGFLEFPNRSDINKDAWYAYEKSGDSYERLKKGKEDSFFFQNLFALAMVDVDFKYLHLDFGSTCVFPKRFEFGYMIPTIDRVVYQNNVGDYDNLSLFGNFKIKVPKIGSIWGSLYLDEINALFTNFIYKTRAMFAFQAGAKVNFPLLPFTTVAFRYTKIEPYCYTHHGINYVPYYDHYISESYTNNGENLGYYLPPNSDEFLFKIESRSIQNATIGLQYQLIRHGVDWGSQSVKGSNIYSELPPLERSDMRKYFLRDGVYEWMNIISIGGSYDFNHLKVPVKLFGSIGYIYQWYTGIDGNAGKDTSYHYINTNEYYDKNGFVFTIGLELFN